MRDPYAVLGVDPSATPAQIREAFRRAVRREHPDAGATDDGPVRGVIDAYRLLIDPEARARYDAGLAPSGSTIPVRRTEARRTPASSPSSPFGTCVGCGGRGVEVIALACADCAGTGEITELGSARARRARCRRCRGAGRYRTQRECRACGGSGVGSGTGPAGEQDQHR